jgi:hypothetical protein
MLFVLQRTKRTGCKKSVVRYKTKAQSSIHSIHSIHFILSIQRRTSKHSVAAHFSAECSCRSIVPSIVFFELIFAATV